jgi:LDH2 family malate/lactate/ureidoglycolate dehydrogenase
MSEAAVTPILDMPGMSALATRMLQAAGMPEERASDMAAMLQEADLLGHRTHGFAMLPTYLDRIEKKAIATSGEITVLTDTGATLAWHANKLPGAWVMRRLSDEVLRRVGEHKVVTATIAHSSHIGCLQAYLRRFTDAGLFVTLSATNPGVASVAPFGGTLPVLTSNPVAYGIPTDGEPILIDQCTSVVSNAAVQTHAARGERTPGLWLVDGEGNYSDDASQINADPPATIAPLGGPEFGYKGYGLGLMVEALTLALSGYGRTAEHDRFGQSTFLQVIDPAGFAGRADFSREMTELALRCLASPPRRGGPPVRLPGRRALAERPLNLAQGMPFHSDTIAKIAAWGRKLGVDTAALQAETNGKAGA